MSNSIETLPVLEVLSENSSKIKLVTNLDSKVGRGQKKNIGVLKQEALKKNIPVFQTNDLKTQEAVREIKKFQPEIILTADFGQFLDKEILNIPPRGCLNLHPSLLPKYRGANPITEAILRGELNTGVSLFLMSQIIDGGKILFQKKTAILKEDTAQTLKEKLFVEISAELISVLIKWKERKINPFVQEEKQATYTKKYSKKDGEIDWNLSAEIIERRIRAFFPWPGSWTLWKGKKIKIIKARLFSSSLEGENGEVFFIKEGKKIRAGIFCGKNCLEIEVLQLEGKKKLFLADFIRGQRGFLGEILGKN